MKSKKEKGKSGYNAYLGNKVGRVREGEGGGVKVTEVMN